MEPSNEEVKGELHKVKRGPKVQAAERSVNLTMLPYMNDTGVNNGQIKQEKLKLFDLVKYWSSLQVDQDLEASGRYHKTGSSKGAHEKIPDFDIQEIYELPDETP